MIFISFLTYQDKIESVILKKNSAFKTDLQLLLEPVLDDPKTSSWTRCYHARTDGWYGVDFHSRCDDKGPTVTLLQVDDYVFGGYASVSWTSE